MNEENLKNLIHDIKAVFGNDVNIVSQSIKEKWINITLVEDADVTYCDFPHLLTIAKNYNVIIKIFSITETELGILFGWL